jgi:hypothetical protein
LFKSLGIMSTKFWFNKIWKFILYQICWKVCQVEASWWRQFYLQPLLRIKVSFYSYL